MKLQDVLLKAMAKRITWWEAAEIIGVTDRTMRRWRERLEKDGYAGLADRWKGRPSRRRIPLATVEEVLRLYQEVYHDLNIRHFHEKLREEHGIRVSYTWVQKALQGAGLVTPKAGEKVHKHLFTQVGKVMRELGVQMITAYSPHARGRGGRQVDILPTGTLLLS